MKTKTMKLLFALLLVLGTSYGLSSCSKDPVEPNNEIENKDHEDPMKAELMLVEGHLHGTYRFHQNPDMEEVKYLSKIQKMTISSIPGKGWTIEEGSVKQFNVRSAMEGDDGWVVYGLWINYYNAKGELITHEFVENGQDQIHQHFFIPRDVKPTFDGEVEADDNDPEAMFDYIYCDTNPWDKNMYNEGAKLVGDKNPVGMKGYFKFKKTRKQFDLSIELMHAARSKFDTKDGKASPFHSPSRVQRQRDHWDLKIKVPVVIYANQMECLDEAEIDTPEDEIPETEMRYLKSVAEAYDITWQEALKDVYISINGDVAHDNSGYWF